VKSSSETDGWSWPRVGPSRLAAIGVAALALGLLVVEVLGIVNGLHTQRDSGTVDVSTIVIVQGVLGGTAVLLAGAVLLRAMRALARPGRRAGIAVLITAVLVAAVWAVSYLSAYGG
jgi:hypothetical protein